MSRGDITKMKKIRKPKTSHIDDSTSMAYMDKRPVGVVRDTLIRRIAKYGVSENHMNNYNQYYIYKLYILPDSRLNNNIKPDIGSEPKNEDVRDFVSLHAVSGDDGKSGEMYNLITANKRLVVSYINKANSEDSVYPVYIISNDMPYKASMADKGGNTRKNINTIDIIYQDEVDEVSIDDDKQTTLDIDLDGIEDSEDVDVDITLDHDEIDKEAAVLVNENTLDDIVEMIDNELDMLINKRKDGNPTVYGLAQIKVAIEKLKNDNDENT